MTIQTHQQQFLANANNKARFISMLTDKLEAANILVQQASNDADVLIIETALKNLSTCETVVVGEDIDLLLLIARTPSNKVIYFLKPGKSQMETKIYSSQSIIAMPKCQDHILFLHAVTGCDTTSSFFRKGKTKIFKLFEKRPDLVECAEVFSKIDSSPDIIIASGIKFILAIYGASQNINSIDSYRYLSFVKNTRKNKSVQLACLPPTSASAHQHVYRVYYQVQVWLGNNMDPEKWGWTLKENCLKPIPTLLPPAPENLLNTIFCNCKKGCNNNCGCRKVGLFCTQVCSSCQGQSCHNVELSTEEDEDGAYDDMSSMLL